MSGHVHTPGTSSEQEQPAKLGVCAAYDGSVQAQAAVRWAAAEAVRRARPLRVIHAVDFTGVAMDALAGPRLDDWPRPLLEAGREVAATGTQIATSTTPSVRAQAVVLSGSPAQTLVEESRQADLMVLGTRGRGDLSAACLGSVSTAVAARASCPVVIVPADGLPKPGPGFPVAVGVDGSTSSARALELAADIAAGAHARLHVVTVWTASPKHLGRAPAAGDRFVDAACTAAEQVADHAVDAARTAHPDLDVSRLVVQGHPGSALGPAVNGAGLLVLGSRGRGAFAGLALGSVGHQVVRTAHCPVMVVRGAQAPRPRRDAAPVHVLV